MRFKKQNVKVMEGDLTPMIDMAFLLISFFMLLVNFSETDRAEEITLPVSALAVPPAERPDYQIILNLELNGAVKFHGQVIDKIEFLTPIIRQEINSAAREGINNPGEIAVIIRSHEDTPTGLVQRLIMKCQQEKLENFNLRVKEKL